MRIPLQSEHTFNMQRLEALRIWCTMYTTPKNFTLVETL